MEKFPDFYKECLIELDRIESEIIDNLANADREAVIDIVGVGRDVYDSLKGKEPLQNVDYHYIYDCLVMCDSEAINATIALDYNYEI